MFSFLFSPIYCLQYVKFSYITWIFKKYVVRINSAVSQPYNFPPIYSLPIYIDLSVLYHLLLEFREFKKLQAVHLCYIPFAGDKHTMVDQHTVSNISTCLLYFSVLGSTDSTSTWVCPFLRNHWFIIRKFTVLIVCRTTAHTLCSCYYWRNLKTMLPPFHLQLFWESQAHIRKLQLIPYFPQIRPTYNILLC